ncbi:hypothetical protein [Spirillospora sp. NBC_01491]|uniref:hypothetical protein n=1 Tax=Spirillospora sp. NBC_01491 TaxID=2976007 RepID=UPI002E36BB7A|nr:hypothetical protein [Spirillospora sp. NBC_01491]
MPLVLVGLVGIGLRGKPEDKPAPAGITAEQAVPTPPERNPVRGEYVPPRPPPTTAQAPRRARQPPPVTAKPPVRKPPRRVERGRSCRWGDIPFLRKWCQRRGYSTR